jgi:disulfide bond formation protein DsbB
MTTRQRSLAPVVWIGVLGLLGVSLLFAPVITGGWCAHAPIGGTTLCESFQRSIMGIDTSVWLWLASVAVVVVATVAAVRRRRKTAG